VQVFDRQYKLFGVINLIDLVVLLAALVAGFAVYRVLAPEPTPTGVATGTEVHYTVFCPQLRWVGPEQVKVGDAIYKATGGGALGKVEGVRATPTPSEAWSVKRDALVPYESSVYRDIWIDVVVKGKPTPTGVAVGEALLHGGMPMPVMTSTFQCDSSFIATLTIGGK
jgi:hypothetical protein